MPFHSPRGTRPEIVAKIIYLRHTYHFGPWKIQLYLKRYHNIHTSKSGVYSILKRLNMNLLPSNKRYKRHKERWKRYCQYTAIDDCTRLRVLRVYPRYNQRTSIQFIDYVLSRLPIRAEAIQTNNGSEFQRQFHWHVLDKGINHVHIKSRMPRLDGKVERSHRIDEEEFFRMLNGVVIDDTNMFNEKLKEWEDFYNLSGPHAALGGKTPYERF